MRSSYRVALCGVLSALAILFMLITTILPIANYVCSVMAGICVSIAAQEFGSRYGAAVYIAVSLLSVMIVAEKDAVIIFVLLMGMYPVLKYTINSLIRPIRIAIKLVYVNTACFIYYFAGIYLMGVPKESFGKMPVFLLFLANYIMIMYDIIIDKYCFIYNNKLRKIILKDKR